MLDAAPGLDVAIRAETLGRARLCDALASLVRALAPVETSRSCSASDDLVTLLPHRPDINATGSSQVDRRDRIARRLTRFDYAAHGESTGGGTVGSTKAAESRCPLMSVSCDGARVLGLVAAFTLR